MNAMIRPIRPSSVEIVEVGPRDGLQNESAVLATSAKIELVRKAVSAGVRRVEVTSFVNPKRVPQMADAEAVLAGLGSMPGVRLSALVLNERGFERAVATAALHEITFVVVASESLCRRNQGMAIRENLEEWRRIARRAAEYGLIRSVTIAVSFGCPYEGEVPVSRVVELARSVAEIGADELSLADTIGVGTPPDVEERFGAVAAALPDMPLRAHFHNTRNTGYANADAAIRSGVRALDASLGGIGGCPFAPRGALGNIATEDLVYLLDRSGVATGLSQTMLNEATLWLEARMGRQLPAQSAHLDAFPGGSIA